MRTRTLEQLAALQKTPSNIRNICILAHVDHGKTTLADGLVASNGIISQRMAGKMRYMDSREDEQERGITMKSSAISLFYEREESKYLINLIDSPGHVDFSSEVSTAVRLCDGAVVLVDVVEGVCPQTHAVLRQAWLENIKPIVVLNKIDRLVLELKMSPLEAYIHLQQILVKVNLLTNELFTSEAMEKTSTEIDKLHRSDSKEADPQLYDWTALEDEDENMENKNIYFSPDHGNVVFASALDGWGFTISHFANLWSQKLGMSSDVLEKTLWGDFYLNNKSKRIMRGAQSKAKKPLFVQFVLEQLWSVYDAVVLCRDKEKTEKIIKSLNIKVSARDARHNDARIHLQAIASQWLPLSNAVLGVVVDMLPSPLQMSEERVEKLMCSHTMRFDSLPLPTQKLKDDFLSCSPSEESPVIVFVSKMFPVERRLLPQNKQRPLTDEELQLRRDIVRKKHAEKLTLVKDLSTPNEENKENEETVPSTSTEKESATNGVEASKIDSAEDLSSHIFVAFARVFSGKVKKGSTLYVLGPKHSPEKALAQSDLDSTIRPGLTVRDLTSSQHITKVTVQDLYLFMGRELEALDEIPAGNVLGIGGLEDHILKSGTVSSTVACPAFTEMFFEAEPIVRVAIEPAHPGDMSKVTTGLKLLNQADPCVQVHIQATGEHVIITAGEVHLQRCVDDLQDRYAKVEVSVSDPIVPFRETIIIPPTVDMVNEIIQNQNQQIKTAVTKDSDTEKDSPDKGLIEIYTPNRQCVLHIRAVPLPESVTLLLLNHPTLIKTLDETTAARIGDKSETKEEVKMTAAAIDALKDLKEQLKKEFETAGDVWKDAVDHIWSFGPRRNGPNVLLNKIPGYGRPSVWSCLENVPSSFQCRNFDSSIVNGFQLASLSGPLCEEPMQGVCFVVEKWEYVNGASETVKPALNSSKVETDSSAACASSRTREISVSSVESDMEEEGDMSKQKQVVFGPFSGQLMSCAKDGCRRAFQAQPQRLYVAMYKCIIQATNEVLGKLYAVLGKRNGQVLSGDMNEGTQSFNVEATLPIIESFGFAQEIRKRTSGLASPQLKFSHWEVLDIDPFWTPTTEEEYTLYGEKADSDNRARTYMNKVRKRKGLKVDEKIVEFAEKQRTLTKMK